MMRSSKVLLSLFACAAASCAWLVVNSGESIVASAVVLPGPKREHPPSAPQRTVLIGESTPRAVVIATHDFDSVIHPRTTGVDEPRMGLVRVSGRVLRGGRALADYSLAFHAVGAGPDADEADWDLTDADGRFEVWVPPADYRVLDDDHGVWLTNVSVSSARREQVLDIELPSLHLW